ncbi:SflA family class IV lanthipeptide [Streptomyces sp. NBC_00536]|uniref:SflA family class IV lanthipeptide n=1 Tax=Streptomyces sp. NBC_00536 TaxID=2975769 RepID=UPI002E820DCA|nr:SflA family class IV lanthipeptide [Streptomyces sp. NBC_00536]WUC81061.1 SflA family class IV lanthipeptide [Streptomyces sp. NBC_00536]
MPTATAARTAAPKLDEFLDAGPLLIDDEMIAFEDDDRSDREHTACLADPWVTATTRFACDNNS